MTDEESWQKPLDGLDAISDFNDKFDSIQNDDTLDALLGFTDPATPTNTQGTFDNVTYSAGDSANGINQPLMADTNPFQPYPEDFGNRAPSSPYFQSVEAVPSHQQIYQPSQFHNNAHRRSVSEPPGMNAPPMTFHRERHYLGNPVAPRAMPLKSQPKPKQPRSHPYARGRVQQSPLQVYPPQPPQYHQQHQQQQHHQQQQQLPPQHRPHMQRSQTTQPFHGPTSVPYTAPSQHYNQFIPLVQPHTIPTPMPVPMATPDVSQYIQARLCTPTPQTPPLQQQSMIDPSLTGSTGDRSMGMRSDTGKTMSIPVTVDELKEMISEAVRAAFFGEDKSVKEEKSVGRSEVGTPNVDKDIVV
ncbi:unnamed protein product [Zymoseptoria tritici ST99CH_1A5]|uniref:Uncharacterized protein n=3 Tax=Zymoseptoria tritici TaxID=1047171 RepID=A0A1X7RJD5_ZYMT9|nr:unnamed protein product [Zymoseptoria tritici ST99CH_3D7]SMR46050.1 unnamed protein product [Zymoseptoria tritici ST99CH_1E4]SMR47304.1 unnamed protein product [Zymoseptoria tritici ST99CH_3D1]SMY21200.1 unnamed protein product [Zymoseptoria tritici ST99CH_1A5]